MSKSGHVKHGDLCLGIESANPGAGLRLRTCAGNSQLQVRYRVSRLLVEWVGLTRTLSVPLSAKFSLGWWEFGIKSWAAIQDGETPK